MAEGSGTSSSLLWEVKRILSELPKEQLPQCLMMENVPAVVAEKNKEHFDRWLAYLRQLGYQNFWKILNARDYGVPQNRERCFCVSILSDEYVEYEFPEPIPLERTMKDCLEDKVDEKYYIKSEKADLLIADLEKKGILEGERQTVTAKNMVSYEPEGESSKVEATLLARDYKGPCNFVKMNAVAERQVACDLTLNDPEAKKVANCVTARENRGICNQKSMGNGVAVLS